MKNRILITVSAALLILLIAIPYNTNGSKSEISELKSNLQKMKSQLALDDSVPRADAARPELREIIKRLRKTDTQLRNMRNAQQQLTGKTEALEELLPGDADGSLSTSPEQEAIEEEIAFEQEKREIETTVSQLQQSFDQEEIDAEWAPSVENSVVSKFEEDSPEGVSLIDAQCRSSFCRIVVGDDQENTDFDPRMLLADQLTDAVGFYHSTLDESGYKTTELYVSRNGYSLPVIGESAEN